MARPTGFRLALAITCLSVLVVALGAYTRLSFSGLGCPDWPGCYGSARVPSSAAELAGAALRFPGQAVEPAKAWTEMIHRYLAGSLALLVFAQAWRAWRLRREDPAWRSCVALAALLLLQATLGMWTVTWRLWPQVVTLHLLGGLCTFALSLRLVLLRRPRPELSEATPGTRRLALAALCALVLQIGLGGWTSTNHAGAACLDFPTCHGAWWPAMQTGAHLHFAQPPGPNYLGGRLPAAARTAIQMAHRAWAVLLAGLLLALAWRLRRQGAGGVASALGLLLGLQLGLGAANLLLHLRWPVSLAHTLGALALLGLLVDLRLRLPAQQRAPLPTWPAPSLADQPR